MKRVNFQISADDHTRLKVYAAQNGKTITELLVEHIRRIVENETGGRARRNPSTPAADE